MKKVLCSIVAIMLLFAGCSTSQLKKIDDYKWDVDIVQNSSHMVVASSSKSSFKSENNMEITCRAKDGKLYVDDLTNSKNYIINYKEVKTEEDVVKYSLTSGSAEGNATVSIVKNGNKSTPTFYMTMGGYSLRFFPSK